MLLILFQSKDLVCIKTLLTTYYLHFSLLLFILILTLKNLNTIVWTNFYPIKVIGTTK